MSEGVERGGAARFFDPGQMMYLMLFFSCFLVIPSG